MSEDKWPEGFEWAEEVQKETQRLQELENKRTKKKKKSRFQKNKEKWENPYGINDMSDEEFSGMYNGLLKKSVIKGCISIVIMLVCIVAFILLRKYVNWGF